MIITLRKAVAKMLVILLCVLTVACSKGQSQPEPPDTDPPVEEPGDSSDYSALAWKLVKSKHLISTVVRDTSFTVSEGVEETDIRYANKDGKPMELFILKVDLNNPNIRLKVATPFNLPQYNKQTVVDMAKEIDAAGHRVVAGFNGDFYNTSTLVPMGIVHKDEAVIKNTFSDNSTLPQQALSFFAMLKNGKPFIGSKTEYGDASENIRDATGGGVIFVKDHKAVPQSFTGTDPRTAVGYTEDGYVYWVVADGRNAAYSNGLTYAELATIMTAFGVKDAVNLDGGGSSTFMIKDPATSLLEVRNRPSDGTPRAVANAWLVVNVEP